MSPRVMSTIALMLLLACSLVCSLPAARNRRFPTRIKPPCCVELTTTDISGDVISKMYRRPSARSPCVEAIILKTDNGSVCADPKMQWVKDLIANMVEV